MPPRSISWSSSHGSPIWSKCPSISGSTKRLRNIASPAFRPVRAAIEGRHMDWIILALFLAAAFCGGLVYGLFRPAVRLTKGGVSAELGVGVANGLIGGLTGLGGIAITIWCQLRGEPKDAQRAIFQPILFTTFAMTAVSLAVAGTYTIETM